MQKRDERNDKRRSCFKSKIVDRWLLATDNVISLQSLQHAQARKYAEPFSVILPFSLVVPYIFDIKVICIDSKIEQFQVGDVRASTVCASDVR